MLTNPKSIGSGTSPIGSLPTEGSEYMSFSDDYMFLGHVRTEIGGNAGRLEDHRRRSAQHEGHEPHLGTHGPGGKNDDQFTIPLGNLLVIGDDQSPYAGWFIAVHQAEPDTQAARRRHGHPEQPGDGGLAPSRGSASRSRTTSSSRP